jgi:hypothetical protein
MKMDRYASKSAVHSAQGNGEGRVPERKGETVFRAEICG